MKKKAYTKPMAKKNEPLVNITFATAGTTPTPTTVVTGTNAPGGGGALAPAITT